MVEGILLTSVYIVSLGNPLQSSSICIYQYEYIKELPVLCHSDKALTYLINHQSKLTRITQRVILAGQELLTLPEFTPGFYWCC